MRCYICDRGLSHDEISYNRDHQDYDPCPPCLHIISEVFDDHLTEDEIDTIDFEEFNPFEEISP